MMDKMRTKHSDRLVLFSTGEQHRHLERLEAGSLITDLRAFKQQAEQFNL